MSDQIFFSDAEKIMRIVVSSACFYPIFVVMIRLAGMAIIVLLALQ